MPQLRSAATYHGRSARFRRCAYHAKVMKMFEAISRPTVTSGLESMPTIMNALAAGRPRPRPNATGDLHQHPDDVGSGDDEGLVGLEVAHQDGGIVVADHR